MSRARGVRTLVFGEAPGSALIASHPAFIPAHPDGFGVRRTPSGSPTLISSTKTHRGGPAPYACCVVTMSDTPAFTTDYYVVTGSVIPVLWLTAGLATNAISGFLRPLTGQKNAIKATAHLLPGGMRHLLSGWVWALDIALRCPAVALVAGFLGEVLSLVALFQRADPGWLRAVVLSTVIMLSLYAAIVILISLLLAQGSWLSDNVYAWTLGRQTVLFAFNAKRAVLVAESGINEDWFARQIKLHSRTPCDQDNAALGRRVGIHLFRNRAGRGRSHAASLRPGNVRGRESGRSHGVRGGT